MHNVEIKKTIMVQCFRCNYANILHAKLYNLCMQAQFEKS
ncbi:hypothetical protein L581_1222 [Serratia fonticola AU-AP2C]|nr:hypothetical protein L581_1222 [Serratia fonticola AU-AP2C]